MCLSLWRSIQCRETFLISGTGCLSGGVVIACFGNVACFSLLLLTEVACGKLHEIYEHLQPEVHLQAASWPEYYTVASDRSALVSHMQNIMQRADIMLTVQCFASTELFFSGPNCLKSCLESNASLAC